jgi:hypothetical protein
VRFEPHIREAAGQVRLFPKLGCYEQLGSSVLRLIPLGSRAKIQVSESLHGMFETKDSCPVGRVFAPPLELSLPFSFGSPRIFGAIRSPRSHRFRNT